VCECVCLHASPPFHVIDDDGIGYVAYIEFVRQPIVDLDILHHHIRPFVCSQQSPCTFGDTDSYQFCAVPSKSPSPNTSAPRRCAGETVVGLRLRAPFDTLCTRCKHYTHSIRVTGQAHYGVTACVPDMWSVHRTVVVDCANTNSTYAFIKLLVPAALLPFDADVTIEYARRITQVTSW
jgi:hypothetical protein